MSRSDHSFLTALAALAMLVAMITVTVITGTSQETFEVFRAPGDYTSRLLDHPGALRLLFGLDSAFIVFYTAFFILFARRIVTPDTRTVVWLALGALLVTAVLDMIEDHSILSMLYGAENGVQPSSGHLAFQHVLSSTKFHFSYVGLFLVGLCVPRDRMTGRVLALFLTVGNATYAGVTCALPVSMLPLASAARWLGFVIGCAALGRAVAGGQKCLSAREPAHTGMRRERSELRGVEQPAQRGEVSVGHSREHGRTPRYAQSAARRDLTEVLGAGST
jgi:hypothetical protein